MVTDGMVGERFGGKSRRGAFPPKHCKDLAGWRFHGSTWSDLSHTLSLLSLSKDSMAAAHLYQLIQGCYE